MSPTPLDHLLVFGLLVIVPLRGRWKFRRLREAIADGGAEVRRLLYRQEILRQWSVTAVLVALWLALGRSPRALGLVLPIDVRSIWGAAIAAALVGLLWRQWRTVVRMSDEDLAEHAGQAEALGPLLPRSDREAATFGGLAVTAGVCEEILYRGYLIAYLAAFMPLWPAAVVGGAAFGIAHAYQGGAGMLKTGATGILNGLLYVGTGSLVWPTLIHAAVDLHGGAVGRRILRASA